MAASKKIDAICIVITVLALILTILFMNGKALGLQPYSDPDGSSDGRFSSSDLKKKADTQGASTITLRGDSADITGNGAYFANGVLTIAYKGTYVLNGTLNGQIVVDADGDDKIWLVLDGLSVKCEDNAALYVKNADKVFVNLVEGSSNSFECGNAFSSSALKDNIKGAIFSRDDLTLNGTGELTVTGGYAHGIVCKDSLKIAGGTINVTARSDALHANDAVYIKDAGLTVKAGDDGITVSNDEGTGEFYMASGTVDVSEVYEGIEAENILVEGGELNISCKDDGFNATSTASGSGITVNDGTISIINTGGRDADGMDSNRDICINGGTIFVSVPSDGNALDCGSENGGKTVITGGSLIACGGTMMAESPDESTTQPTFMQGIQGNEGDVIRLETSDGEEILNKTVPNSFSAVTVSLPEFKQGLTYKLICGDQTKEITFTETVMITDISDNPMGGGGPGGGGPAGGGHP